MYSVVFALAALLLRLTFRLDKSVRPVRMRACSYPLSHSAAEHLVSPRPAYLFALPSLLCLSLYAPPDRGICG